MEVYNLMETESIDDLMISKLSKEELKNKYNFLVKYQMINYEKK